jgi:hypothetical protein
MVDPNGAIYPVVGVGGTLVDQGAIGISDVAIRRNLVPPCGNGTIADPEVLKLEKFTLGSLGTQ